MSGPGGGIAFLSFSEKGAALAERVSRETGVPVLCHVAEEKFISSLSDLSETVFPITIQMKKPWE